MSDFVHLHNHSEYSLLDGLSKVEDMVLYAKELGMKALAITDHGNLYGAIKFYTACKQQGIKPIIGCEMYLAKRSIHNKESNIDNDYNHLILLAKDMTGYKNLMKLITIANLQGYYYRPRIDLELLKKYHEGLIGLSACVNGFVSDPLVKADKQLARKNALELAEIFGENHFYLELQKHLNVEKQNIVNEGLIELSQSLGIPLVATNDNHYIKKDDAKAQEILLCIQTQTTILQENRKLSMISSPDFYIKDNQEMTDLFAQTPQAIQNTLKIADMCNLELTLGKWIMPIFNVPEDMKPAEYLKKLIFEGLSKRYPSITEKIAQRAEYEISVITKKGYETYILIVADFVNWAKKKNITVGPGRGSAAGSLICYALGITDIDPFYFNLSFERFLNPLRPSAPDIDLDFADNRRDEVIEYVTNKYGKNKVAQIITFGTMEARGAVRDAGRALGMPYKDPDRIAKMIPPGWQGHAMTIKSALSQSPDLKRAYESEKETKRLLDVAQKLEGVARHASIHAAGVVISDRDLDEYTPLQKETNGDKIVTQYDMYTVGEDGVGLLKMDLLGLRNLTIIDETLKLIKQTRNQTVDFSKISFDDPPTYQLLSSGETTGIFQLESAGMRRYIKELKPTTIFDIMAMVALYRPGPMQNIPEFISRKNNSDLIKYPDPRLKDVLAHSYGILAYQDDVLLTSIKIAGYTWLDADKLRKAVGKKIPSEMKKQKLKFIEGAIKNGLTPKAAEKLFDLITPFAGYGFNKAHAACYATIAFRTAYLKAHFSVEFMTALLTAESRGATGPAKNDKIAQAVAECRRLKIHVLLPDINKSDKEFAIENENIRFGLSAIKNVGSAAIETILSTRSQKTFENLEDFCKRVDLSKVNKKTVESLIKAGAMDGFGKRTGLLMQYPETTGKINRISKDDKQGQVSLFDETQEESLSSQTEIEEFTNREKLSFEKEYLGLYLTSHPNIDSLIKAKNASTHNLTVVSEEKEGTKVKIGGIIESSRKIFTKRTNSEMAFLVLSDENGSSIECVVFPSVFEKYKNFLIKDSVIIVNGKVDAKNDKPTIIVDSITPTDSYFD